ncbi:SDR family oxidoreductase [Naumannella halotolerans]|uniref:NAD(P)H dehydrogenase (Quinone) n=1 Tax=Naumannella halotolerans TaxID=993414 RepID=A0A4R7J1C0_9ACTN|nr:SDR family oxidoreductase [Naumannella halotolerans]TDT30942.1 NAD(P)H dehydrogenase (quinone) [Naumannella halotolerans]
MSILVTGATGHLGRLTIDSLLARGVDAADIVAFGRSEERLAELAELGVRTAVGSYDDPASLDAAFAGVDRIGFISGSEVGQRSTQHANVVDAAARAGVGLLAYTSAPHADTSDLVLAPEHKATEEKIAASGVPAAILRNNWYTENYVRDARQAAETGVLLGSTGDGKVASASRKDFAEGLAVVLTSNGQAGKIYELGGDVAWDHAELAATIGRIFGREVVVRDVSTEEHIAARREAGLDEGSAGFVATLDANIKNGDLAEVTGELSALIGRPTTQLEQGLREALA